MELGFDRRLGIAGLFMGLVGIAASILWPDEKWIGWICLFVATCLLLYWAAIEIRQRFGRGRITFLATIGLVCVVGGGMAALFWRSLNRDHKPEIAEQARSYLVMNLVIDGVEKGMVHFHFLLKNKGPREIKVSRLIYQSISQTSTGDSVEPDRVIIPGDELTASGEFLRRISPAG